MRARSSRDAWVGRQGPCATLFTSWFTVLLVIGVLAAPRAATAGLNQWTTAGPEGGLVRALALDPQTPAVVYAGSDSGAFKSSTGGAFWTPMRDLDNQSVFAFAVDPQAPTLVYAGTSGGFMRSTDGGATWSSSNSGLPGGDGYVSSVAVNPRVPTTMYAGTFRLGVFRSLDRGMSWSSAGLTNLDIRAVVIDPQTPATVYAGTFGGGVFKSTNSGSDWREVNTGLTTSEPVHALAIDPQTPNTVYVGTDGGGLLKSTDGGELWTPMNDGLTSTWVTCLLIDPRNPATVYAGTDGSAAVFKSTNGGASWSQRGSGLPTFYPGNAVRSIALDGQQPDVLFVGTYAGVFRSTDGGGTWGSRAPSLVADSIYALALDPRRPTTLYAGGLGGGVVKSVNGGASWSPSNTGLTPLNVRGLAVDASRSELLYAATGAGVFKSVNGGVRWGSSSSGITDFEVTAVAVDPLTPTVVYAATGGGRRVFKSTDGGTSWTDRSSGLPDVYDATGWPSVLAIAPDVPSTMFVGNMQGLFKSTNAGASWTLAKPPTGSFIYSRVTGLAIDPLTPRTLYVAHDQGVFKSTDSGTTWRLLSGVSGTVVAIAAQSPGTLFAGGAGLGVFRSTDAGATWSLVEPTFRQGLFSLLVNPAGTCAHAGINGGVYSFATRRDSDCLPPPPLDAAVFPPSLSVQVGQEARTFATVANVSSGGSGTGGTKAADSPVAGVTCGITQLTGAPTPFTFQAVDPMTDQPAAPVNTPVDIAPGTSQRFRVTLTPSAPLCPTDIQFGFNCTNTGLADIRTGLNTLLLSAGPAAGCGLSASVTTSQASFVPGQTLVAGGSVTNSGVPGGAADFYVGVLRPDRSIQFVTPTGLIVGNATDLSSFRPLATNVPLTTPFTVSQSSVFTHAWTADDPRGSYVFFVLTVKAGALSGGIVTNDQILKLATAPYSFP